MKTTTKETVQQRILNAAEELFANSSYSATRVSDIAALAGANQALVHYYFNSKEELYKAVLERLFEQWESHLYKQDWRNMTYDEMMKKYIESHFEMKCRVPNLYKIFHKESIDGGKLFNQYASTKWTEDYREKIDMFKAWKKEGIIDPHLNEQVVLFCIWGMMNQFYYREQGALEMITGEEGDVEQLRALIVQQMVALTQRGISNVQIHMSTDGKKENKNIVILDIASEHQSHEIERGIVLEATQSWERCNVQVIKDTKQLSVIKDSDLTFVLTSSKYGELSSIMVDLLQEIENKDELIMESYIGIWVTSSDIVNNSVQKQLESVFNNFGAFVVARPDSQTLHGYLNRCAKMSNL